MAVLLCIPAFFATFLFKRLSDPLFRCNHSVERAARCCVISGTAPLVGVRVRLSPVEETAPVPLRENTGYTVAVFAYRVCSYS
jgi:hypothetical protein